jgi:hypothetical protein
MLAVVASVSVSTGMPVDAAAELARQALRDEKLRSDWLDDGYATSGFALCRAQALEEAAEAADRGALGAERIAVIRLPAINLERAASSGPSS